MVAKRENREACNERIPLIVDQGLAVPKYSCAPECLVNEHLDLVKYPNRYLN